MAAKKFLRSVAGVLTEVFGVTTSAGAGNDGDIVALDASGRIDATMMPTGIGADTKAITTSEALAAGDFVNLHISSGIKARKADATVAGKAADGFVIAAVGSGASAAVYFDGPNTQVSGLTPGTEMFLSTTAGLPTATVPSGAGNVAQRLGIAVSATEINFERGTPVTLA
jgi:hypothetical protein